MKQVTQVTWEVFGIFLCRIRKAQNLSQNALAYRIGCTREHICRLENGSRLPSVMILRAIARELSLSENDMKLITSFEEMIMYHCEQLEVRW